MVMQINKKFLIFPITQDVFPFATHVIQKYPCCKNILVAIGNTSVFYVKCDLLNRFFYYKMYF